MEAETLESTRQAGDSFSHVLSVAIAKIIQTCANGKQMNIVGVEGDALASLAQIAEKIVCDLAGKSQTMAEVNQRTSVTVHDVLAAMIFQDVSINGIQQHIN